MKLEMHHSLNHIHHLHNRKSVSERRKRELIHYLENLKRKYKAGEIPYSRYVEIIHHKKNGRTIEEWIHYYHLESLECHRRIIHHHKKLRKQKLLTILFISAIILSGIFLFYNGLNFSGFVSHEDNLSVNIHSFSETFNEDFYNTEVLQWFPENQGQLNSVKLSGSIEGEGEAKVYIEDILILDTSELEIPTITRGITGLVTDNKTKEEKDTFNPYTSNRP